MTFLGKTFVLVNLFLSLLLGTVAFGLYANSLDWTDKTPKGGKQAGLLKQKEDEITRVAQGGPFVQRSWLKAEDDLLTREVNRGKNRAWYTAELEHPETKATAADSVRSVVRENFEVKKDAKNFDRPEMAEAKDPTGKKLLSLKHYNDTADLRRKDSEDTITRYKEKIDEDLKLTEQLAGTKDGARKGLRQELADERVKLQHLDLEGSQIRPLFVNVAVESELALRRLRAMEERIKELEDYLKAHKVDVKVSRR